MNLGILSDTHDNLPKVERAVRLFNRRKVNFVLHAGDFVAPFTVLKIKKLSCDWQGVFGNNDGERKGLARVSEGRIKAGPLRITLAGKKIVLAHDISTVNPDKEDADVIICGHSHKPEILKKKNKLILNPGEAGGWLTGHSTVAILELETLTAKIFKI